jgi:hypothetical protein
VTQPTKSVTTRRDGGSVSVAIWSAAAQSDKPWVLSAHKGLFIRAFYVLLTTEVASHSEGLLVSCGESLVSVAYPCWPADVVDNQRPANSLWR